MTLTEKRALAVLVDGPADGMSTIRISELLVLTPNTVGPVIKRFLLEEWVERSFNPRDGRMRFYRLTELGRHHYERLCYPRRYCLAPGLAGAGRMVTACQYLGTKDSLTVITRMLGVGVHTGEPVPNLVVNDERVSIGHWVTIDSSGSADLINEYRFPRRYLLVDDQHEGSTR